MRTRRLYLLDQIDRRLQIHAEIDEGPCDTFALVLFLLEHEHVVVEVLLQLLVGEVDAELLEAVELHSFMHHDAHRHTAKRQIEKEEERAREKERHKTVKKTGRGCCAIGRTPSVSSRLVLRSLDRLELLAA